MRRSALSFPRKKSSFNPSPRSRLDPSPYESCVKLVTRCDVATVSPTAHIARTAIVGNPYRPLLDGRQLRMDRDTVIEAGVWIGHYTAIGQGVKICADSTIEDFVASGGLHPGYVPLLAPGGQHR